MELIDKVKQLAQAIAKAEGFYVEGSLPQRAKNPGDLEVGDIGYGCIAKKTVFPTVEYGWGRLEFETSLMLTGKSHVYKPTMTILEMAKLYTGDDSPETWAACVAQELGLEPGATLQQFLDVV